MRCNRKCMDLGLRDADCIPNTAVCILISVNVKFPLTRVIVIKLK